VNSKSCSNGEKIKDIEDLVQNSNHKKLKKPVKVKSKSSFISDNQLLTLSLIGTIIVGLFVFSRRNSN
jgi:hypothetical protein